MTFADRGLEFLLDFGLRFTQHVLDDPFSGLRVIARGVPTLPATVFPLANVPFPVCSSLWHKDGNKLTDFISIKVRGPLAERCAEFAWKGCKLAASGDFETITFADEPERQPGFLIKATEVEFLSPRRVEESAVSMPADGMDEAAA